jgi:hypothetical protein
MKSSDSTEIDRLLRRYSRLKGETLRADQNAASDVSTGASSSAHLDADEMSAYAEGALPEAARSRYFAHLADCHTCRKLITELTLAASISIEEKERVASPEVVPSNSWRRWMAAIFSPPVLRYGVPALALLAVIVVAIVAMRSQREAASVAQNKDESRYSAPTASPASDSATANTAMSGTTESHANSNTASLADQQSQTQANVAAATPVPAKPAPVEEDAPVVSQNTVAKTETAQSGDTKDNSRDLAEAGRRGQAEVTVAAAPPPAPQSPFSSAPAASETASQEKREEPKKPKVAGKDDSDELSVNGRAAAGGDTSNKTQTDEGRNVMGSVAATSRPAENQPRRRSLPASRSGGPPADTSTEKERSAETRNVGGRRFQKQGSAWVDTAYNSSRPTTNIRRGSEQYRALVADEPGLRAIAEQLTGQVIVVWNSRAYRFY